jgi:hypothetical protein
VKLYGLKNNASRAWFLVKPRQTKPSFFGQNEPKQAVQFWSKWPGIASLTMGLARAKPRPKANGYFAGLDCPKTAGNFCPKIAGNQASQSLAIYNLSWLIHWLICETVCFKKHAGRTWFSAKSRQTKPFNFGQNDPSLPRSTMGRAQASPGPGLSRIFSGYEILACSPRLNPSVKIKYVIKFSQFIDRLWASQSA